jgi:diguanylate cyclase (GGDEF)-like protein
MPPVSSWKSVVVLSRDPELLPLLEERCPEFSFSAGSDAPGLVIVDGVESTKPAPARIILGPSDDAARDHGELRVSRETFLERPAELIRFALEYAEAASRATFLENELETLGQVQELMTMTDAGMVSEKIAHTVLGILNLRRVTLLLHDPRLERYVASFTNDPLYFDSGDFLSGVPPALLQEALESGRAFAMERNAAGEGLAVMPLEVGGDLVGVIRVPLAADDSVTEAMIAGISNYLALVVRVLGNLYQITRSNDLAMRDDLTKAFNRRFFDSYLDEEIERARRYKSVFSIIFLDLDDLKAVNNRYGHLSGSRTLQEVAKRIMNAVRGIDKVVRFGGDEFCIILPQTDQPQALLVARRVLKAIVATPFHLDPGVEVAITASFGIATYPTHAISKENLVRQADAAMFRVKSTTKNDVGIAEPVEV